ncbi:MAG: DUF2087 domain-containing protein [Pseudomonadota bacterium]
MPRSTFPLYASDISALARSLREQLSSRAQPPSHLELLNMLARSNGFRNFQALRAQAVAQDQLAHPEPPPPSAAVDYVRVQRLARFFDADGRLIRWPGKLNQRLACLWVVWSRLPARQVLDERQVKERLQAMHRFDDHALLRRMLCDHGFLRRTPDCREYRRVELTPPPEGLALIRHLGQRSKAAAAA